MDAKQDVNDVETTVEDEQGGDISPTDSGIGSEESSNASDSSYQTALGSAGSSSSSSLEDLTRDLELADRQENDNQTKEIADIQLDHALEDDVEFSIDRDGEEKPITLRMDKTATMNDVLNQASLMGNFAAEDYDLSMEEKVITPRTLTLRDASIPYGSRLRLAERPFQIFIRQVDGRTITVTVRSSNTVEYLKEQYNYLYQVPIHQQRLLFQCKELENTRTMQHYGIRTNSTVEMVYRLRGGA